MRSVRLLCNLPPQPRAWKQLLVLSTPLPMPPTARPTRRMLVAGRRPAVLPAAGRPVAAAASAADSQFPGIWPTLAADRLATTAGRFATQPPPATDQLAGIYVYMYKHI